MKHLRLFILFCSVFFISCNTTKTISLSQIDNRLSIDELCPEQSQVKWQFIDDGIYDCSFGVCPLHVTCHVIKIDLYTEGLSIFQYPQQPEDLQTPADLNKISKNNNLSILINTTPFSSSKNGYDLLGISVQNSIIASEPVTRYAALKLETISSVNSKSYIRASIISQNEIDLNRGLSPSTYLIGGYFPIISNGQIIEYNDIPHSNTLCGISKDGRYLYILTAVPDISLSDNNGLYYYEGALILKEFGAFNGLSFDGGKSTCLYIKNKKILAPSFNRKVPAVLGFSIIKSK